MMYCYIPLVLECKGKKSKIGAWGFINVKRDLEFYVFIKKENPIIKEIEVGDELCLYFDKEKVGEVCVVEKINYKNHFLVISKVKEFSRFGGDVVWEEY